MAAAGALRRFIFGTPQQERSWPYDSTLLNFDGHIYPIVPSMTMTSKQEEPDRSYSGYVQAAYRQNGIVFACNQARMRLFAEARFQYRQIRGGRPGDLFGTPDLNVLENPWPNGTTRNLLKR